MDKEAYQQQPHDGSFLLDLQWLWWMDGIKCSEENPGLLLWLLGAFVCSKDGSYHVDTAEDDGGLDGIEQRACIFDKRCRTAMDDLGIFDSMHAAAILQSRMKDVYDGSNQEYNGTAIPVDSM